MSAIALSFSFDKSVLTNEIPIVSIKEFREYIICAVNAKARLSALFGTPTNTDRIKLFALLAHPATSDFSIISAIVEKEYDSITTECPQAHLFEREIAEQCFIQPIGHPWLKPVRLKRHNQTNFFGADFFQVEGESIHEVAVGPVHAGIIEPGHFRFQCNGEQVLHLEISLGYQHRGIESALRKSSISHAKYCIETVAGDTTIGHTIAHCQALETLSKTDISKRSQVIRGIALELERLANHTGDLGALSGDVGYQPTMSFCGRLRGDFLNMSALICGNRFGRGLLSVGGVAYDIEPSRSLEIIEKLDKAMHDVEMAVNLLWDSTSVLARFEDVGSVDKLLAVQLGLVGVPARASGFARDARIEFPSGIFKTNQIPISICETGDVLARAMVRWKEMQLSYNFIREQLSKLPEGTIKTSTTNLEANSFAVSIVEGWRGEICHVILTDEIGKIAYYKIVDPSFHNWMGLAMAMRNQEISDFPLCNKSFNLSYCGHDL